MCIYLLVIIYSTFILAANRWRTTSYIITPAATDTFSEPMLRKKLSTRITFDEDQRFNPSEMFVLDNNGVSAFGRALQDPALMTRAAFWLLNEQQIVEELTK